MSSLVVVLPFVPVRPMTGDQARILPGAVLGDDGRQSAGFQGLLGIAVPIEILTFQGKEKLSRLQGPAVRIDTGAFAEQLI